MVALERSPRLAPWDCTCEVTSSFSWVPLLPTLPSTAACSRLRAVCLGPSDISFSSEELRVGGSTPEGLPASLMAGGAECLSFHNILLSKTLCRHLISLPMLNRDLAPFWVVWHPTGLLWLPPHSHAHSLCPWQLWQKRRGLDPDPGGMEQQH